MTTETIELIRLTASEGMYLTNGDAYGKIIYLGELDSAENWHEITEAEYEELNREEEEETQE